MTTQTDIERLVEMVTTRPGYMRSIGTRVLEAGAGRVRLAVDRRDDLLQFNGFFHGGVISGLADHAAGGAVTTALPKGRIAVTIDLHINFIAPADGPVLIADARAVQVGGTICVATVEVGTERDGALQRCALATATLRVVDLPATG
jgi:uncharacterized protein (TIGR00369 family)